MTATTDALPGNLRADLQPLSWPERFERLSAERKRAASPSQQNAIAELQAELARRALEEMRHGWGAIPLKHAILRLDSKYMRAALGRAAKEARDECILELASASSSLPDARIPFGVGMDERVLELPMALRTARLHEPGEVLDAGAALNVPVVRRMAGRPAARVTHFTLPGAKEPVLSGNEDRFSLAFGDLRTMPYPTQTFDRVVCISTLEHVGMDNARFGASPEQSAPESAAKAVAELLRVLSRNGELLITVPYGRAADHGWFRVFDQESLGDLLRPASHEPVELRFFYYDSGWLEGNATPSPAVLNASFSADVITGIATARITRSGSSS